MNTVSKLLLAGLALAATAAPADATLYNTSFTGVVSAVANAPETVGSTIAGSFSYDSAAMQFISFKIDGFSATAPFTSVATTTPGGAANPTAALFEANQSAVQGTGPGTINRTFTLDLEALTNFNTSNALTLLTTPNLFGQLDTSTYISNFSYVTAPSVGGSGTSVAATLTSLSTAAVPEPASLALLAAPVLGMALRRRR